MAVHCQHVGVSEDKGDDFCVGDVPLNEGGVWGEELGDFAEGDGC